MKNIIIPIFIFGFLFLGATFLKNSKNQIQVNQNQREKTPKVPYNEITIFIQPLGEVEKIHIETIKSSLESFYGFPCVVKPKVDFTRDLLSPSKTRYEGGKILDRFRSKENILVITEKDITTQKGNNPEWGIFGLGYRPGSVCVVSTFRLKRNATAELLKERIVKVALHEVGHNLGLDHCPHDLSCLMNDARGTITQVDNEKISLCIKCKKQIGMN